MPCLRALAWARRDGFLRVTEGASASVARVLAKDCRMESVNSNIGRQFGQQQQEGYSVNGAMSFQMTLK